MAGERNLPGLGLTGYWDLGSAWKEGMDENLRLLSAVAKLVALSRTDALPGSPTDGNIYIVPDDAAEHANEIAIRDDGEWVYVEPQEGWEAYVVDEEAFVTFIGTEWVAQGGGIPEAPVDGTLYGRVNAGWVAIPPDQTGVEEAPADGTIYGRKDNEWVEVETEGGETTLSINDQTGSYTLVLGDATAYVRLTSASAVNLTVPPNGDVAFPVGTSIPIRQGGAGQVTVVAGSGVTVNTAETLKLRKQHSGAHLIKVATNEWDLVGDVETV